MLSCFETLAAVWLWEEQDFRCSQETKAWKVWTGPECCWETVWCGTGCWEVQNVTQSCASAVAQSCENGDQRTLLCLSCLSHAHHAGTSDHLIWSTAERWVIPREGSQGPGWVLTEILRVLRIKGMLPEPSFVLWVDSAIQKRQTNYAWVF